MTTKPEREARNARIVEMYAAGLTPREIADREGITPKYAGIIATGRLDEVRAREKILAAARPGKKPDPVRPKYLVRDIVAHAADIFSTTARDIVGEARFQHILPARYAACYVARELTAMPYTDIGHHIGDRDHSSIIHGRERCMAMMAESPDYAAQVAALIATVKGERKPQPVAAPEPEPEPAAPKLKQPERPREREWWEFDEHELLERRIAEYRASGGSFVEVRS